MDGANERAVGDLTKRVKSGPYFEGCCSLTRFVLFSGDWSVERRTISLYENVRNTHSVDWRHASQTTKYGGELSWLAQRCRRAPSILARAVQLVHRCDWRASPRRLPVVDLQHVLEVLVQGEAQRVGERHLPRAWAPRWARCWSPGRTVLRAPRTGGHYRRRLEHCAQDGGGAILGT